MQVAEVSELARNGLEHEPPHCPLHTVLHTCLPPRPRHRTREWTAVRSRSETFGQRALKAHYSNSLVSILLPLGSRAISLRHRDDGTTPRGGGRTPHSLHCSQCHSQSGLRKTLANHGPSSRAPLAQDS